LLHVYATGRVPTTRNGAPQPFPARRGSNANHLWTQQLPNSCIICFGFSLDENSKLLPKAYLRKEGKWEQPLRPEAK